MLSFLAGGLAHESRSTRSKDIFGRFDVSGGDGAIFDSAVFNGVDEARRVMQAGGVLKFSSRFGT